MSNLEMSRAEVFEKEDYTDSIILFFGVHKSLETGKDLLEKIIKTGVKDIHVVGATKEIKNLLASQQNDLILAYYNTYEEAFYSVFPGIDKWLKKTVINESPEIFKNKEIRFNQVLVNLIEGLRRHSLSKETFKLIDLLADGLSDKSIEFRKGFVLSLSLNPEIIDLREAIEPVDIAFDDVLELDFN